MLHCNWVKPNLDLEEPGILQPTSKPKTSPASSCCTLGTTFLESKADLASCPLLSLSSRACWGLIKWAKLPKTPDWSPAMQNLSKAIAFYCDLTTWHKKQKTLRTRICRLKHIECSAKAGILGCLFLAKFPVQWQVRHWWGWENTRAL